MEHDVTTTRTRLRRALAVAASLAAVAAAPVLAGCATGTAQHSAGGPASAGRSANHGHAGSGHSATTRHARASHPAAKPKVDLTITVRGVGGRAPRRWTLQCDPPGGTHPDPAVACRVLLRFWKPFALEKPGHMACPMIAAGAAQAEIRGTWFGYKVDKLVAAGGCDQWLWAALGTVVH
jgi:Subtilisin inhibitor-like